ncbi:MAG: hypothetical protein HOH58_13505 [Opitutaceae bacterium]|jgi:hypothetical protein|nr:hypothetical protein [Opitutaceae bacterium]
MEPPIPEPTPAPMISTLSSPLVVTRPHISLSAEDRDPESCNVRAFRWLLTFGFPAAEAAAAVRPDIFKNPTENPLE